MRRTLLSLVVMVLCTVLPLSAEIHYVMEPEGFEGGLIPAGWTAETPWTVEGGADTTLTNPDGCAFGLYRAGAYSQLNSYVSASLITPAIDLTVSYQDLLLAFSYAAVSFRDVSDTLKVYYRLSPTDTWHSLGMYLDASVWKKNVEVELPSDCSLSGDQAQFRFELCHGDAYARGVVLDNVLVYGAPTCTAPEVVDITPVRDTLFIQLDANTGGVEARYDVLLSEFAIANLSELTPDSMRTFPRHAIDSVLPNGELEWHGLKPNQKYYLYARTNCDDNLSGYTAWTKQEVTTPMLIHVPHTQTFDSTTTQASGLPAGWTALCSNGLNGVPAVLTSNNSLRLTNKYLFFGSTNSVSSALSAGQYVYAVAPQLDSLAIRDLQISFWAAANRTEPGLYAPELEVGAMTNISDPSSFRSIATVKLAANGMMKKFTVNFASYTGEAYNVAFRVKGGDLQNQFAIDNVTFEALSVPVPSEPVLKAITPNSLTVEVNKFGADSWNLLLADSYFHDSVPAALISQSAISGNTATIAIPDSLQGKVVTIYAQGIKGGNTGAWSFPLTVRVPLLLPSNAAVNYTISGSAPDNYLVTSLVNEATSTSSAKSPAFAHYALRHSDYAPQVNGSELKMGKKNIIFSLGYVENLSDKEVVFLLRGTSSLEGKMALGVMTNPYDESTFTQVAEFDGTKSASEYAKCVYDFDQYTGAGNYVAFKTLSASNFIKSVSLDTIPFCREVAAVKCVPGSTSASFSWEANNMSKWQILVSASASFADTVANAILTTPAYTATGLQEESTYYYKVNTICDEDTIEMYGKKTFATARAIPFEVVLAGSTFPSNLLTRYTGLASSAFDGTLPTTTTSGWTVQGASSAPEGMGNNFKVNIYNTSCKYWMVTPALALDVDSAAQVRLTFDAAWTKYGSALAPTQTSTDDKFMVLLSLDGGASWDQSDAYIWANDGTGNMGTVDTVSNVAQTIEINLSKYIGKSVMIAFYGESTVAGGDNDFHVANIKVSSFDPNCPGVRSVSATNVTENTVNLVWTADGTQQVTLQISTVSGVYTDSVLVYNQQATTSPVTVTGLESNKHYYVRAIQTCDPNQTPKYTEFKTACAAYTVEQFGVESFGTNGTIDCWTLGLDSVGSGMSASTYSSSVPGVTTVTGFGSVLYLNKRKNTTYYNYGNDYYAILPLLDVDSINKYQLTFSAAAPLTDADVNARSLVVGIAMDASTSFTSIDTINIATATDSTSMKRYTISFDGYKGDRYHRMGKYVVLMASADEDHSNQIYLDNFFFELANGCHQVIDLETTEVVDTCAVLKWSSKTATEFELAVADTLYTGIENAGDFIYRKVLSQNTDTVRGLQGLTTYYAFVRAICAEGDTSIWSPSTVFTTECSAVVAYPWTENFDSVATGNLEIDCWTNQHIAGSYSYLMQVATNSSIGNATHMLKLQDQQTGNVTRLELPLMNIPEENAYEFRFDMYRSNYSSIKQNEGFLITVEGSFGVDTLGLVPRQYTVSNDYVEAVATEGWYKYAFTIPHSGNIHVVVYGISEYGKESYADNFEVRMIPTCPTPKKVRATALSYDTAQVAWNADYTDFIVELSSESDFSSLIDSLEVSGNEHTFRGLVAGATYYVRVRSNCAGAEWAEGNFATANALPFVEDFNASTSIPNGWTRYNADIYQDSIADWATTSYWYVTSNSAAGLGANHSYSYTSSYSYCKNLAFVTPEVVLNNQEGNIVVLSFDLGLVSGSTGSSAPSSTVVDGRHFSVAVMTADSAIVPVMVWSSDSTATEGAYGAIPTTAKSYSGNLTQFAGQKVKLIFYHANAASTSSTSSYIHMDNIKLSSINPNCMAPEISVENVTNDSLTIFVANNDSSTYMVEISTSKTFASVADSVVISDSIAAFSGLTPATVYYARVKKLCGEGEESAWTDILSVQTDCEPLEVPFTELFRNGVSGNFDLPTCWTKVQSNGNYPYVQADDNVLYFYGGGSTTAMTVALPELAMPLNQLTLNVRYDCQVNSSYSTYGTFKVGYLTELDGNFVAVQTLDQVDATTLAEVILTNVPAEAHYLALCYNGGQSNYGHVNVHSVMLTVTPTCLPLKSISFANVQRRSLDINWTPKAESSAYDLVFSPVALSDSALAATTPISVDTTFYHVEGLTRGTTYYVYVRANCGEEDGVGEWMSATVTTKTLQACETVTVAEGTMSNSYVPVYGYYVDDTQKSQSIYPASMLTELVGQQIASLKYHVSSGGSSGGYNEWGDAQFAVRLANVTGQSLASDFCQAATTTVYTGTLTASVEDGMTITFNTPFTYTGGDLLIEFEETVTDGYSGCYFYGITYDGGSRNEYSYGGQVWNFLPMVDFTYCYATDPCPAVEEASYDLLGDGITSAKISWSASSGDYAGRYVVCYTDNASLAPDSIAEQISVDSLNVVLTGLSEATQYYAYIKTVCDAEGHNDGVSTWKQVSFETNANCPAVVDLAVEIIGKNSAAATWTTVYAEQAKTFQYVLSTTELDAAALAQATLTNVDTTVLALDALINGQTYYLYVASRCDNVHGAFRSVSFTAPATCPAVVNLHAQSIAFNAVQLAWNRGAFGEETEWEVGIVGQSATRVVSDSTALIIGLNAATDYRAFVKALCSETEASASASFDFTTANEPTGETEIGSGTNGGYNAPFNNYYKNSWNQSIYSASTIGQSGTIQAIAYHVKDAASSPLSDTIRIYMAHTPMAAAATEGDWVAEADLQLVYADDWSHETNADEWEEIQLQTNFEYNGTDNLAIIVAGSRPSYSSALKYYYTQGEDGVVLYRQNDSNRDYAYYPGTETGSKSNQLPDVRLNFILENCRKVANLQAQNITKNSADVNWFPGAHETSWNTIFSATQLDAAALATAVCDTTTEFEKHFSGLNEDADYYFYVRAICSATEHGEWKELHFVTDADCRAPKALHADTIGGDFARISWSNNAAGVPAGYVLAYGKSSVFDLNDTTTYKTVSATDTTAIISGLSGLTFYKVAVAAACDAAMTGRWSESFEFQTECAALDIPWSENFNGTPNLVCWTIPEGTSLYTYASYARSGNALKYATADSTVTILPDFGDLNGLQLTFWYRMEGSGSNVTMGTFQAGYITNPSDPSSFVAMMNCPRIFEYTEVEVPYISGIPAGARPAIKYHQASSSGWYAFIDDVKLDSVPNCVKPVLSVANRAANSVTIALGESADYLVEFASTAGFTTMIDSLLVSDSIYTIGGLTPGKTYYARAKRVCGPTTSSDWSMTVSATTTFALPFSENFSDGLPTEWTRSNTLASDLFTGTAPATTTSGWNYQVSTSSNVPSGMADNMKVNIYGTSCKYWMFTPAIDATDTASYSNIRLSFDVAWTKYNSTLAPTQTSSDDKFLVAVSLDGGMTWEEANSFVWANDGTGNMGLLDSIKATAQTIRIDMTPYAGNNLVIGFYGESTVSGGDNDFHVSNVLLDAFNPNCAGIEEIAVRNIGTKSADIQFTYAAGNRDAYIEIAASETFANPVVTDTILNDSAYHVTGLEASSTYYVRIKQLCGEDEESGYTIASFLTAKGVPYSPDFSDGIPAGWNKYTGLVTSLDSTYRTENFQTTTSGWSKTAADTVINAAHIRGEIWSSTFKYWLISPSIDLTENQGDGIMLNVDLGLTPYSSYYASSRNNGTDDRFMIVISEDGGKTWNMSNATIWDNNEANHTAGLSKSYNDIPEHGQTVNVNLTNYTGKNIAIGFYGESTTSNADNWFHFGNIKLKTVETTPVYGSVCDGYPYEENGFNIRYSDYHIGENLYSRYVPAADTLHQDSIYTLHLMVNPTPEYVYADTICWSESYTTSWGEIVSNPTTKAYSKTLSSVSGCDSLITCNLFVREKLDSTYQVLKCQGEPFVFKGTTYSTGSWILRDTTNETSTGCDSTITIYLEFSETEKEYSLHREVICPGDEYNDDLFDSISVAGLYTATTASIYGCDSIVTLKLMIPATLNTSVYDTITTAELPYVVNGRELLPVGTPVGRYRDDYIMTACGAIWMDIRVVDTPTGVGILTGDENLKARKVMIDQRIYLIIGDKWYDATGKHVEPVIK